MEMWINAAPNVLNIIRYAEYRFLLLFAFENKIKESETHEMKEAKKVVCVRVCMNWHASR